MLIPDKYKDKCNQVRSEIMEKVAEGPEELADFIKFKLIEEGFTKDECSKVAQISSPLKKTIEEAVEKGLKKSGRGSLMSNLKKGLAIGAGLLGIGAAGQAIESGYQNYSANQNFQNVLKENTSLRKNPKMPEFFNTIKKFSPSIAQDKHALETVLEHANEFGRIDYPLLKQMRDIEKGAPGGVGAKASGVASAAKAVGGLM